MPENFERPKAANENIPFARRGFEEYIADVEDLMDYAHRCIATRTALKDSVDRLVQEPIKKMSLLRDIDPILNGLSQLTGDIEVARLEVHADRLNGGKRDRFAELATRLRSLIETFDAKYEEYLPLGND
jgi:hypothetical protein